MSVKLIPIPRNIVDEAIKEYLINREFAESVDKIEYIIDDDKLIRAVVEVQ